MRRAALVLAGLAALASASAAHGAPPRVTATASDARGAAPLTVTLQASGDLATYHWDLGDGSTADGPTVQHVYGPGAFTAAVTARGLDGSTSQAQVKIAALALTLRARAVVPYRGHLGFRGRLIPVQKGVRVGLYLGSKRVARGLTRKDGRFRIGAPISAPGRYIARLEDTISNSVNVVVRPLLRTSFSGTGLVQHRLVFHARVRPAGSAKLRVRVWRGHRLIVNRTYSGRVRVPLPTGRVGAFRIRLDAIPTAGFVAATKKLRRTVFVPRLGVGSSGASVSVLERELARQHYALGGVDGYYGHDTYDAVVAFQKVHWLPRTGSVDARVWRILLASSAPTPRFGGDYIDVDKSRQVLFIVRNGRTVLVVPVSTGATGNTPIGRFSVYSKVPGFNSHAMYYSSFFIGGFAIHGYASVPTYPASHGCVRIPLWVATRVYGFALYGSAVVVHY
ncbi:MAG: L,D-transpeptidase family protein [Actinomycetota bacterium]|nr:L,D-transpeptidase family protein [Actinomycetota bacterium]